MTVLAAAKTATVAVGAASVAVLALDPTVQVAWIAAAAVAFTSLVGAVASIVSVFLHKKQGERIARMEINVDGRLSQLLKVTEKAATAEGFAEGRKEGVSVTETGNKEAGEKK